MSGDNQTGWRVALTLAILLSGLIGFTVSQMTSSTSYVADRQMIMSALKTDADNIKTLTENQSTQSSAMQSIVLTQVKIQDEIDSVFRKH